MWLGYRWASNQYQILKIHCTLLGINQLLLALFCRRWMFTDRFNISKIYAEITIARLILPSLWTTFDTWRLYLCNRFIVQELTSWVANFDWYSWVLVALIKYLLFVTAIIRIFRHFWSLHLHWEGKGSCDLLLISLMRESMYLTSTFFYNFLAYCKTDTDTFLIVKCLSFVTLSEHGNEMGFLITITTRTRVLDLYL